MRIQEIQTYDYLKRKVVVDGNGNLVLIPPIDKRLKTSIIEMIMRYIKGTSSRYLRQVFPQLKRRLPSLWTHNYFVATVGGVTLESLKR